MYSNKTTNRRQAAFMMLVMLLVVIALIGRLGYLMLARCDYFGAMAKEVHERERKIKAERGRIFDRNGIELAGNEPVSTISVIHSQIKEPKKVIRLLSKELSLDKEEVQKKVNKVSSREKIASNVPKDCSDRIREYHLEGVMVDEDYKRSYPLDSLASKVIGFTGSDNQGIIGLEVSYDSVLAGESGIIYTKTTSRGIEIEGMAETRKEPAPGKDLYLTLDVNIQKYAAQAARKVQKAKQARSVRVIVMNPQNGEIYALVNEPEFNLNKPYMLKKSMQRKYAASHTNKMSKKTETRLLNEMWRNFIISDTYEPGSTFKVVTATAALEENVVKLTDTFHCPGYRVVEDRRIRCHKAGGHGSETFVQGIQNSCNPVFMDIGARLGIQRMYKHFRKLGLFEKTGVDLPGEAGSIMHRPENVKAVELATISFGQSFQITPLQLVRAVSAVVNGGKLVTPHFGLYVEDKDHSRKEKLIFPEKTGAVTKETSKTMRKLLESVVSEGTGKNAYLSGFRIGGKTATSEKLPRRNNKYISSFIGFAPANQPKVIALILIDEPVGIYYGGTIAAPVIAEIFENILPYVGVKRGRIEEESTEAMGKNDVLILY
ncbi:MAG: peptidoglycan glycosyltransferase [Lachnospiraceae bacterium]|nr:peptidoglycan glycosyltransferase [Lachnospiraceae bacterium]